MVKNIRLDRFITSPVGIFTKNIDFNRQSFITGWQLTYQKGHFLINHRMIFQVVFNIDPEDADIGHTSSTDPILLINLVILVMLIDLFFPVFNVILQQLHF